MKRIKIIKNYQDGHIPLLIGQEHEVMPWKADELITLKVAKLLYKEHGKEIETNTITNFETR